MRKISEPVRVGTVGTSKIMRIIQDAMRSVKGFGCSVVYSRDLERAKRFAREMEEAGSGPLGVCDSLSALADREDVDVVYLASPNILHYEQAMQVMKAGKSVIIEKPVATAQWKMRELYRTAVKNDVMFLEAISTLFMPNYLKLKAEVLPRLGKLKNVRIGYGRYSSQYDAYKRGDNPNVFSPVMEGGAMNDMGIYCIHMAVDLFGEPDEAACVRQYGPDGADLADSATLRYRVHEFGEDGLTVQIETSKIENIPCGCWIEGENGSFVFNNDLHDFINGGRAVIGDEEILLNGQGDENRMVYEQAAMRDCLLKNDREFFERMYRQSLTAVRVLEMVNTAAGES